ncbi:hypothetical protein OPQ81_001031 [Rhizoctonia solani]|nr:hypothetical protein OPQ81_001031 [Rhizoctonia solani]
MTAHVLFRTNSNASSYTYYEKASPVEGARQYTTDLSDTPSGSKCSMFQASRSSSIFIKAARGFRRLVSAVQNINITWDDHSREPNGSHSYPDFYIQEKYNPRFGDEYNNTPSKFSVQNERTLSGNDEQSEPWVDLPQSRTHTFAPSTNTTYESSIHLNDEALKFANAFLPAMEPLEIRDASTSAENNEGPPSVGWIRRHTSIRPGNVIQIPSASDKGAIYLLSRPNGSEWKNNVDLSTENDQSLKLFMAHAEGSAEQPVGCHRAFIVPNPGTRF